MSLDVYLQGDETDVKCKCVECGNEHTRHERPTFFSANITHNLGKMAEEAGIYKHLWRPEEIKITKASQLIGPLRAGLKKMKANPTRFKKYDASNGWGTYKDFVPWIEEYLAACEKTPDATIKVSR